MTHDADIERALVAEALRRYERFVARGTALEDFTVPVHRLVLEACADLWERGEPISVGSVALELQRKGRALDGGERAVAELAVAGSTLPDHERLRELTRLRRVMEVATRAALTARDGDLAGALSTLAEVDQLGISTQVTHTGGELAERVLAGLMAPDEADQRRVYVGLRRLDGAIGKLPAGSLTVVGADTNVGKSSFVLAMLIGIAEANITCGLISVEDPEDVTGARLLSAYTEAVSSREIQHGRFTRGEQEAYAQLAHAAVRIKRLGGRLLFEDRTGETELDVCGAMSRMAARGAKLIVVDYVQEIAASKPQQDRRNEVRWVTKRLKSHAKRLGVALVLVSQIARPKDGDEFKPPSKHALKESGDLVNAAEVILLLWRESATDDATVFVRVAKCKWGGVGLIWPMHRSMANGAMFEA
jgi:replicative DNA helicase